MGILARSSKPIRKAMTTIAILFKAEKWSAQVRLGNVTAMHSG